MEIKINQEILDSAVAKLVSEGVCEGISSWKNKQAVSERVGEVLAAMDIGKMVSDALKRVDLDNLTLVIAKEIERNTVKQVVSVLQEVTITTVGKIRSGYISDKDKEKLRAELYSKEEK